MMMLCEYRVDHSHYNLTITSDLRTQLKGHFLGLRSQPNIPARRNLLQKHMLLFAALLPFATLILLHLLLRLFQILTYLDELLAKVFDLLILPMLHLID